MWPVSIWHISERAYCCSVAESFSSLCDPIARQAFLSSTISWSLFRFMSVELEMPSSPFAFSLSQHQGLFQWVDSSHQVAKILELQHQSFQWIFRVDFLYDWLVWSPCCPRDSQESSSIPQFKSISSSVHGFISGLSILFHWSMFLVDRKSVV